MARDPGDDFVVVSTLLVAGLLAPAVVVAAVPDPDALPVDGQGLVLIGALAFGAASLLLIERRGLDRVNVLLASVALPWPLLVAAVVVVLLVNPGEQVPRGPVADVFRFLIGPVADLFVYGGAYGVAGAVAYGGSRALDRRRGRRRAPRG